MNDSNTYYISRRISLLVRASHCLHEIFHSSGMLGITVLCAAEKGRCVSAVLTKKKCCMTHSRRLLSTLARNEVAVANTRLGHEAQRHRCPLKHRGRLARNVEGLTKNYHCWTSTDFLQVSFPFRDVKLGGHRMSLPYGRSA